jgi:hypothetical protein
MPRAAPIASGAPISSAALRTSAAPRAPKGTGEIPVEWRVGFFINGENIIYKADEHVMVCEPVRPLCVLFPPIHSLFLLRLCFTPAFLIF